MFVYLIFGHSSNHHQTPAYYNEFPSFLQWSTTDFVPCVSSSFPLCEKKAFQRSADNYLWLLHKSSGYLTKLVFLVNNSLFVFIGWEWSPAMTITEALSALAHPGYCTLNTIRTVCMVYPACVVWASLDRGAMMRHYNVAYGCHMLGWR